MYHPGTRRRKSAEDRSREAAARDSFTLHSVPGIGTLGSYDERCATINPAMASLPHVRGGLRASGVKPGLLAESGIVL